MFSPKQSLIGITAMAATLVLAAPSHAATVIKLITPTYPGTVTGTTTYSTNETLDYKFTVAAPYRFSFTASGSGGTFPFPIVISATGTAGTYTEKFGPFPVKGTVDYSLTTVVPEPGVWILMIGGFGLVGLSARRRAHVVAA